MRYFITPYVSYRGDFTTLNSFFTTNDQGNAPDLQWLSDRIKESRADEKVIMIARPIEVSEQEYNRLIV